VATMKIKANLLISVYIVTSFLSGKFGWDKWP